MGDSLTKQLGGRSTILQWAGPAFLAVASAWATITFAAGQYQNRITTLENENTATKAQLEKAPERYVTREEYRQFLETVRHDLDEIKKDVRHIRDHEDRQ